MRSVQALSAFQIYEPPAESMILFVMVVAKAVSLDSDSMKVSKSSRLKVFLQVIEKK